MHQTNVCLSDYALAVFEHIVRNRNSVVGKEDPGSMLYKTLLLMIHRLS